MWAPDEGNCTRQECSTCRCDRFVAAAALLAGKDGTLVELAAEVASHTVLDSAMTAVLRTFAAAEAAAAEAHIAVVLLAPGTILVALEVNMSEGSALRIVFEAERWYFGEVDCKQTPGTAAAVRDMGWGIPGRTAALVGRMDYNYHYLAGVAVCTDSIEYTD